MAMAPHVHSEEELKVVAEVHIAYELRMMSAMAVSRVVEPGGDVAATALFEATLTHLRNLDEFLTATPPGARQRYWEHQVCAHHYLEAAWAPLAGVSDPTYRAITRKVSHIYCDRADLAYEWPGHECPMVPACLELIDRFDDFLVGLAGAGHDDRRSWFQPARDEARQTLDDVDQAHFVFMRRS